MTFTEVEKRVCAIEGCETILSRFNSRRVCATCEVTDRRFVPRAAPSFPSRPPAPSRPVLEGAVPLPAPVRIRERSYAEMIEIDKPPSNVAYLPVRDMRMRSESGEAAPLPNKQPARKTPSSGRGRGGSARTFDWDEAARLMGELHSYKLVAEKLGVSHTAACAAVKAVLGDEAAKALVRRELKQRRRFDWDEAVRRFDECGNASEVARQMGRVSAWAVRDAIVNTIGQEAFTAKVDSVRQQKTQLRGQCKRDDCTQPAAAMNGIYARLCREHARIRKLEAKRVTVTRPPVAVELEAQLDAIEVELDEVAELIRKADEVAA